MNTGEFDYQIYKLSKDYFTQYAGQKDSEILIKDQRPYNCLLIETKWDYFICVPYRSEIRHKEAYLFRNTRRSGIRHSGLDYSKMIILEDLSYIDSTPAIVDSDEFTETRKNINKIAKQANEYLDTYINHCNGKKYCRMRLLKESIDILLLKTFIKFRE